MRQHRKNAMLALGHGLLLELEVLKMIYDAREIDLLDHLDWEDYHDFPIAKVPISWMMWRKYFGFSDENSTVQIGRCLPSYKGEDHYHRIGHQLVMPLGYRQGFPVPRPGSYVTIANEKLPVRIGDVYYFETGVTHGFRGDFYFINIQSPPLIVDGNDDYYNQGE